MDARVTTGFRQFLGESYIQTLPNKFPFIFVQFRRVFPLQLCLSFSLFALLFVHTYVLSVCRLASPSLYPVCLYDDLSFCPFVLL